MVRERASVCGDDGNMTLPPLSIAHTRMVNGDGDIIIIIVMVVMVVMVMVMVVICASALHRGHKNGEW